MRQLITQTSEILIKYSLITPLFQLADAQKVYITGALELLGAHLLFPLLFSTLCVCLVVSFPFDRLANKLTCYSGRSFSKIFKYLSSAARRPPLCSRFADERPGNRINRRNKTHAPTANEQKWSCGWLPRRDSALQLFVFLLRRRLRCHECH
jgi:hypothetical protein